MRRETASLRIAAPRALVWRILAEEYEHIGRWTRQVDRCHMRDGATPGVGAAREIAVPVVGHIVETIEVFDAPTRLTYRVEGLPIYRSMRSTWELEEEGDGTRVRFTSETDPKWGGLGRGLHKVSMGFAGWSAEGFARELAAYAEERARLEE